MGEFVINEEFVKLRLTRDLMLERLDELLKDSELTDEECLSMGKETRRAVRLRIEQELQTT
jgi:hypothetical protein